MSENLVRQMRNWARTTAGIVAYGYTISSCYSGAIRDTYDGPREPLLIGESEDVNAGLLKVPLRYRSAVSMFWQYEGRPLVWLARRCGEGVDWRTFERRVIQGHDVLKGELMRNTERVERYRIAALTSKVA
jgi:hypothetical protein